jgi:multicomponent Na+:H+ antiporter subunit E
MMLDATARGPGRWRGAVSRAAMLALLWVGFNGLDGRSWLVGFPIVVLATWASFRLKPIASWHWAAGGVVRFAWFFAVESIRGGFDVARRALTRELRIAPGLVAFEPRLPAGAARLFFCNCVSLLPGTCTVGIESDKVHIHVLDATGDPRRELLRLEEQVAGLFGVPLARLGGET